MTEQDRRGWLNLLAQGRGLPPPYPVPMVAPHNDGPAVGSSQAVTEPKEGSAMRQTDYRTPTPTQAPDLHAGVLRGLHLMDVTIRRHAPDTGRVDVSALAALRLIDALPSATTVGELVEALVDLLPARVVAAPTPEDREAALDLTAALDRAFDGASPADGMAQAARDLASMLNRAFLGRVS
jgi:hypothetical protein